MSADRVKENEDGSLTVYTKTILNTGFYQTVSRYGDGVKIIRPADAREAYVAYLKTVLNMYKGM